MLSLETAQKLKIAGLTWLPAIYDFFAIPDRSMDEHVFVISDMLVTVEMLQGLQVVSFQGSSEWALDSLVTTDAVWLPTETQLRQALEAALLVFSRPELRLSSGLMGCKVEFQFSGQVQSFEHSDASEAYAASLYFVMQAARPGAAAEG
jgi:hypothetical protein